MSICDRLLMALCWILVFVFLAILYILMFINMAWRKVFPAKPGEEKYDKDRVL